MYDVEVLYTFSLWTFTFTFTLLQKQHLTSNSKPFSQLFRHPNLFPLFTTLFSSYEVIFAFLDYEQLWEHVRSTWSHLLDQGICKLWRFILKNFCQSYCRTNISPSFTSWHFWTGSIEMAESAWYLCLDYGNVTLQENKVFQLFQQATQKENITYSLLIWHPFDHL